MTLTRRIGITLLATAMAAIIAVIHHHFLPGAAERIDLHGTWRIVSREHYGQPLPIAPGDRVDIDGVAMTFTFRTTASPDSEAPFRLNARTLPKQLDLRYPMREGSVAANGWDGLTRTVYERDLSTLTLVWYTNDVANPDPNHRPLEVEGEHPAYAMRLTLAR
jgi:uncharacterized protein (TIGR03067 family)